MTETPLRATRRRSARDRSLDAAARGRAGALRATRALPEVPHVRLASTLGVVAMVVQMIGLLRWVFVLPVLARIDVGSAQDPATRAAAVVAFRVVHPFAGVLLGMAFTSLWMAVLSVGILRSAALPRWIGALGLLASAAYSLVHAELLSTALEAIPHWRLAGLVGSLLWLAWTVALGATMLRPAPDASRTVRSARAAVRGAFARAREIERRSADGEEA